MVVNENVQPVRYPFYNVNGAQFSRNTAEEGGGFYVMNNKLVVGNASFNARVFVLQLRQCVFRNNRQECIPMSRSLIFCSSARRQGGGFIISGVAAQIYENTVFESNRAVLSGESRRSGYGGGLSAENGAVLQLNASSFLENAALVGGAVSVFDASLRASNVNFTRNTVASGLAGGAAALEVSSNRDIPVLNSGQRNLNIIFECLECNFTGNLGSSRGGSRCCSTSKQ